MARQPPSRQSNRARDDLATAARGLDAAIKGYDAQYGASTIGEQHDLPAGAVERVQALIDAAHYMVWCYRIAPRVPS